MTLGRVQTEEEERRDEEEGEEKGVESEEAESMSRSEEEQPLAMTLAKDGLLDIPNGHNKVHVACILYKIKCVGGHLVW